MEIEQENADNLDSQNNLDSQDYLDSEDNLDSQDSLDSQDNLDSQDSLDSQGYPPSSHVHWDSAIVTNSHINFPYVYFLYIY